MSRKVLSILTTFLLERQFALRKKIIYEDDLDGVADDGDEFSRIPIWSKTSSRSHLNKFRLETVVNLICKSLHYCRMMMMVKTIINHQWLWRWWLISLKKHSQEIWKHRKNCERCQSQVIWKVKFKCQMCLSCLSWFSCLSWWPWWPWQTWLHW